MDLQHELLAFCKAGRALNLQEMQRCAQLSELLKAHLKQKALSLLRAHPEEPVLFVYSADNTPEL
eukprot:9522670-Lingulodinium_polyedra.AAC.1